MAEKSLMKGNEALAEAAIRAGCKCFFGYPITPQTEISAYLSKRMPKVGGVFLQAESEVAAINMVYGCAGSGIRCMTSSSSPGISLKTEGISYIQALIYPALSLTYSEAVPVWRYPAVTGGLLADNTRTRSRRLPRYRIRTCVCAGDGGYGN